MSPNFQIIFSLLKSSKLKVTFVIVIMSIIPFYIQAQDSSFNQPEVRYCRQEEYYGEQQVRYSDYWQYHQENQIDDTYSVTYFFGTPIYSRMLLDYDRHVAYIQKGDLQYFFPLEDVKAETSCIKALHENLPILLATNSYVHVNTAMQVLDEMPDSYDLKYPNDLLLAPAFIGKFPLLADYPLIPFEGRGFSQEIPYSALVVIPQINSEDLSESTVMELTNFYLNKLTDWELASPQLTAFAQNPTLLPGNRSAYVSFYNPRTASLLNIEFHVDKRQKMLRMLVSVPEDNQETQEGSVIEGSSQSLATLDDFFKGWGDSITPRFVSADNSIQSYVLQRGREYWIVDLLIRDDVFDVIYSQIVTQTPCDQETCLPDWAKTP